MQKSLQKLPNADLTQEEEALYKRLLHSESWSPEFMASVYREDKALFTRVFNKGLEVLAFEDRDLFIERLGDLYENETKNSLWQSNHVKILCAISKITIDKNRFPTRQEISSETNLSKQTINKHLKDYFNSDQYKAKQDELLIMRERVLAAAFNYSLIGDMKAAKVFLDATNPEANAPRIKNQQNNFIQINGEVITQEQLQHLPPTQMKKLRAILSVVNKPIKTSK